MKVTDYFSKKATIVSFIMSIFVIYIHANNLSYYGIAANGRTIPNVVVNLWGGVIGGIAVPFFFIMSAYWLFRFDIHGNNAVDVLIRKMKKKTKTICLPYLLWNAFGMIFYMVITHIPYAANMMNNGEVISLTLPNVVEGVFFHKYYFTFWYLKDLIVLIAISPVLLILLRNKCVALMSIIVSAVAVLLKLDFVIFEGTSLLFFMIGGYAVTYTKDFFENKENSAWKWLLAVTLTGIIRYVNVPIIAELSYFISPILLWKSVDVFLPSAFCRRKIRWFITQSFFVYASHVIPVTIIGHLLAKVSRNYLWVTVSYLISPWITLALIYVVANILYKYTPRFYGLICGGRIKNE